MQEKAQNKSFKSKVKAEAKDAAIYTTLTFINQISSFIVIPLFWTKLTPADYGVVAIIDLISGVILLFAGLSLEQCIPRFYYEWNVQDRKKNLGVIWMYHWISTLILGIISIIFIQNICNKLFPNVEYYPFIFLGLINRIGLSLNPIPFQTLRILRKPLVYSAYNLICLCINIGLPVYFVLFLNQGFLGYLKAGVFGAIIVTVVSSIVMLFFSKPNFQISLIREPLKYAIPMIPSNIIAAMTNYTDKFILQRYVSLEVLGIYNLSMKFANLVFSLHSALKLSYVPFMFKTISEEPLDIAKDTISRISLFYILPLFLFAMGISLYIGDFVRYVNQPNYFPIIKYVPFLVIPALIQLFYMYFTPGLLLGKRTDLLWIPNLVQLITVFLGSIILIPIFKFYGIITVNYLHFTSLIIASYILSEKVFPMKIKWRKLFALLICMILCVVLTNVILHTEDYLPSISIKTASILLYGIIGIVIIGGYSKIKNAVLQRVGITQ